jgi:hypothetical protein
MRLSILAIRRFNMALLRCSVGSALVALCAAVAVGASFSTVTASVPEPRVASSNAPVLPVVVNTWPFVNATRVAFRILTKQSDASAIDAVEQVCCAARLHQLHQGARSR